MVLCGICLNDLADKSEGRCLLVADFNTCSEAWDNETENRQQIALNHALLCTNLTYLNDGRLTRLASRRDDTDERNYRSGSNIKYRDSFDKICSSN